MPPHAPASSYGAVFRAHPRLRSSCFALSQSGQKALAVEAGQGNKVSEKVYLSHSLRALTTSYTEPADAFLLVLSHSFAHLRCVWLKTDGAKRSYLVRVSVLPDSRAGGVKSGEKAHRRLRKVPTRRCWSHRSMPPCAADIYLCGQLTRRLAGAHVQPAESAGAVVGRRIAQFELG